MRTKQLRVDDLKPYHQNARHRKKGQIEKIAESIREFGFQQPIVVDKDHVIIVGHGRWEAAKHMGLDRVPVHVARDLNAAQVRAYRIADNRINEESGWDRDILKIEVGELEGLFPDLGVLAMDAREISSLLRETAKKEDEMPSETPQRAESGDLWHLGAHPVALRRFDL